MALHKILLPDGVTELANIKSVTYKEVVNADVDLKPGCVCSACIEVEVFGAQSSAVSAGDALTYYQIDKNNTQTLIGTFYAQPIISAKNSYKFVAYDAANNLEADFSAWLRANQNNFPYTVYQLVSQACTIAGVTLGSSSWPLSTQSIQAFYSDGLTCRDILSYAAELGCKFVRCHSDGKIYFDWYSTVVNKRIYPSSGTSGSETRYAYKQDGLNYANYTTTAIAGVAVHPSGEDDVAYIYPLNASGNLLHIQNNLLLTGASSSLFNSAAQAIYTALNTLGSYRPASAVLFPRENPFRAGDIVAFTDAQGVSFTSPIMSLTVSDSAAFLESTGHEAYDNVTNTQKAIAQLATDIVQINKLKVDWASIGTAIINTLVANGIDAQQIHISGSASDADYSCTISISNGGLIIDTYDDANGFYIQIQIGGTMNPDGMRILWRESESDPWQDKEIIEYGYSYLSQLVLATPLGIQSGGTGADNSATALSNLGCQFKIYNSVTSIGLTSGSATISGAWSALNDNEILIANAAQFSGNQRPGSAGVIEIGKKVGLPNPVGWIEFRGKSDTDGDYRMYLNSSGSPTGAWISEPNNFANNAAVDLSSYTSSSNLYTIPNDGYVYISNNSGQTGRGIIYGSSGTSTYIQIGNAQGRYSTFVRKGMRTYLDGTSAFYRFVPLS